MTVFLTELGNRRRDNVEGEGEFSVGQVEFEVLEGQPSVRRSGPRQWVLVF